MSERVTSGDGKRNGDGSPGSGLQFDGVNRRRFLQSAAVGGGTIAAASVLAACGGGSSPGGGAASSTVSTGGQPKRGGTLHVGMTGGSSGDTLSPLEINSQTDYARQSQLFDSLAYLDSNAQVKLMLAEEMTPNADATEWTIRLRPDVTWHNGKDLTADDVIYSCKELANPKNATGAESILESVDVAGMRKIDKLTCKIPMKRPYATFTESWATRNFFNVFPVGFDPKNPVGTGPFKYKSFSPGSQSTFLRNENYWGQVPYLDELVIIDFEDETSQINALSSGQVEAVNSLTVASIPNVEGSGGNVLVADGGVWTPIFFRVDLDPFKDPRVLEALKLVVDRKQMLQLVFGEHGLIGNDMFGIFDPAYDHSLPQREQDIEKAKSLLKSAGQEGLSFQLVVAGIAQGVVQAAEIYSQQASEAGVKVQVRPVTETELFGPNYLKWPVSVDYWYYNPYYLQVSTSSIPGASYNETHFTDPTYAKLYQEAQAQPNTQKRDEIGREMNKIYYERGGYVIPYFAPTIDGYSSKVGGASTSKVGGSFDNFNFKALWVNS